MPDVLAEILAANGRYAETFGEKATLGLRAARGIGVVTCMDARLDAHAFAGLALGDAHIVRNAGGRASDDAIRSIVISHKLLGTRDWFVIHHTECGLEFVTDEKMRELLASSLDTAVRGPDGFQDVGEGPGSREAEYVEWLAIRDQRQSIVDDVRRIREHPLISPKIAVYGLLFHVATGRLEEIPEATAVGRPRA
jgi:carbonic anhydrase